MLKLYNKEHVAVSALTDLKDYKIEYLLSGEDSLEFSLSICDENIHLVEEEGYVRNKLNEYVIKAIDPSENFKRFSCIVNIEDIKAKSIKNFDTSNNTITETIRLAIAGTGWILADNNITKRRTVRVQNTNALEVLREIRKVFRVDFRYDAINKIIHVYEEFGEDRGVYFSDELNLKNLSIPSDTYDYATRIYPYGKDGLTIAAVNGGKEYIDNFQYSNKVMELIWEDNRYIDVSSLKEDATAKLDELSKPKRSYQASISDLAKQNEEYKFLDFGIGDTITLLSKQEKFRDKQRIVKYIEYPYNPSSNTCELGNTTLTFEELQKENEAKNQVVDNITDDNGTVSEGAIPDISADKIYDFETNVLKAVDFTTINADIKNLKAENVTITGKLTAVEGEFGTIKSNVAIHDKLIVNHTAELNDVKMNKADVVDLNALNIKTGIIEGEVGKFQTLVNGNLSSENMQAGGITGNSLNMDTIFVKDANMINVNISALKAGDISTNKFRIISDDGGIEIVGATQQWKDNNNRVRIQMGKDTQGNFNFIIRGEDGTTTLIDHTGVKAGAIADDLIVSDMIATDAVGEKQINYSSFTTGFNKDTNTSTIKSTKIHLNNQNQILELAFNSLKTQADGTKTKTESNSTTIGVIQGQISTVINNTQIVKDGQTILLKDDYNRTVATVDSMKSTIGSHTTTIDQHTGKITGVETKTNELERNLNSVSSRLTSTETTVTTHTTNITKAQTDATKGINDAKTAKTQADKGVSDAKVALDKVNTVDGRVTTLNTTVTTTNSKVSAIEQNLNSITTRVSTVESKQTTVDGKVTALETWKKQAEVKITDSSIISTVSSQFYKKTETDKKYLTSSSSTITQLSNQIATKVDVNGVKSTIEQNPDCIVVGFNKISQNVISIRPDGLRIWHENKGFTMLSHEDIYQTDNTAGRKLISLTNGGFRCYRDDVNNSYLGGFRPTKIGVNMNYDAFGMTIAGGNACWYASIGQNKDVFLPTSDNLTGFEHYFQTVFDKYIDSSTGKLVDVGTHIYKGGLYTHGLPIHMSKGIIRLDDSDWDRIWKHTDGSLAIQCEKVIRLAQFASTGEEWNGIKLDFQFSTITSNLEWNFGGQYLKNGIWAGKSLSIYNINEVSQDIVNEKYATLVNDTVEIDNNKAIVSIYNVNTELTKSQLLQDENISFTEDAVNCILMGGMSTYKRNGGINSMASYLGNQIYKGKLEYDEVIVKYPDLKKDIDSFLENKLKNDGLKFK